MKTYVPMYYIHFFPSSSYSNTRFDVFAALQTVICPLQSELVRLPTVAALAGCDWPERFVRCVFHFHKKSAENILRELEKLQLLHGCLGFFVRMLKEDLFLF